MFEYNFFILLLILFISLFHEVVLKGMTVHRVLIISF